MIVEEIEGVITPTIIRGNQKITLVVGSDITDSEYHTLLVGGTGKLIFRIDPSSTLDRYGIGDEIVDMTDTVVSLVAPEVITEVAPEVPTAPVEEPPPNTGPVEPEPLPVVTPAILAPISTVETPSENTTT